MGRSKLTLSDAARRWNRSPIPTGPEMSSGDGGSGPTGALSGGIIIALLVMLGGIVWVWKSSPAPASAGSVAATVESPGAESLGPARDLIGRGEFSKADTLLIPLVAKFPEEQSLRLARAECLFGLKRFAESYAQYEKALAIGPREPSTEFAAGVAAREAGQLERAIEHMSMAQTADPYSPNYALALGQVQRKAGTIEAAKASLLRAAHLDSTNAYAWGTLAEIALSENNANICLQHVSRARALQPDSSEWKLIEARAHKRKGEPTKALQVLSGIESRQRKDAPVARLMAECYGMQGRSEEAAVIMGEAFLASPMDGALAYDAAVAYERVGNRDKALEHAKYAKALGHEGASKLLEKLGK